MEIKIKVTEKQINCSHSWGLNDKKCGKCRIDLSLRELIDEELEKNDKKNI